MILFYNIIEHKSKSIIEGNLFLSKRFGGSSGGIAGFGSAVVPCRSVFPPITPLPPAYPNKVIPNRGDTAAQKGLKKFLPREIGAKPTTSLFFPPALPLFALSPPFLIKPTHPKQGKNPLFPRPALRLGSCPPSVGRAVPCGRRLSVASPVLRVPRSGFF